MTHCDIDHGFARCGVSFVVLAMAAVPADPAEGSLDDPSFGKNHKSFDLYWSQHRLQQPSERSFHVLREVITSVSAVGEDNPASRISSLNLSARSHPPS
jgi:hypothetical protein